MRLQEQLKAASLREGLAEVLAELVPAPPVSQLLVPAQEKSLAAPQVQPAQASYEQAWAPLALQEQQLAPPASPRLVLLEVRQCDLAREPLVRAAQKPG